MNNLSYLFLRHTLKVGVNSLEFNGLLKTYLGSRIYQNNTEWGDFYYLEFNKSKLSTGLKRLLERKPTFVDKYDCPNNKIHYVFRFDIKDRLYVLEPFLLGKYSKISKEYVKKYFPPIIKEGNTSIINLIYQVCNKDKKLKKYWEKWIGVELSLDAEVWSAPSKENEIYLYNVEDYRKNLAFFVLSKNYQNA